MAKVEGALVRHVGQCQNCGWTVTSRNVHGIAAQHADRYHHEVVVETGHRYRVTPGAGKGGEAVRMAPLL